MLTSGNLACVPCTRSVTSPSRSQIMTATSPTATLGAQAISYGAPDAPPAPTPVVAPAPCPCKQRKLLLFAGALVLVYLLAKR